MTTSGVLTDTWDAGRYGRDARYVADLAVSAVDLLDPRPGETILDLGCGDGHLTALIAARCARVVGIDASPSMVAAARAAGVDARLGDGRSLEDVATYDAVFSNAALHWMKDLPAVCAAVRRTLKPGGRFVGELGAVGNVETVRRALHRELARLGIDAAPLDPWTFPAVEDFREMLEAAGFRVRVLDCFDRPTVLSSTLEAWLETFAQAFLAGQDCATRASLLARITTRLAPEMRQADGTWVVHHIRLRFAADAPAEDGA